MVHPDWREDVIEFTDVLGLKQLRVGLLHPIDLIISKLERCADKDIDDGLQLATALQLVLGHLQ